MRRGCEVRPPLFGHFRFLTGIQGLILSLMLLLIFFLLSIGALNGLRKVCDCPAQSMMEKIGQVRDASALRAACR